MFLLSEEVLICSSRRNPSSTEGDSITGHNWRIVASVEASELNEQGEILSQGKLRDLLWKAVEPLDHRHLDDLSPFLDPPGPTPPRVALHVWEELQKLLGTGRVRLLDVAVWTSSTECTRYSAPAP